ncbi:virulence factor Mce-like protein [Nocardia transvalensis]|uniref:Virulence factor Mce-like protein n=1 Tax=Nocardia transvalensis TaxID=37333 RepID=A0A7W9PFP8_9NOCA|nr:MCE family protein [Nocardia transvalensis]MBB5915156.1 virulence factor Mce-like protein [Nocardia transvalensis]
MTPRLPGFLRNRYLRLGLLASATVLILLIGSSVLTQARLGDKTIQAEFAQAAGVRAGATVDVSGIEVGAVRAVRLEGNKVVLDLKVRKDIRLGSDARAAIKMSTILGRMHIDLVPGNGKGLPGNRIPLDRTDVPYNLSKVIQDPQYKQSFQRVESIDPQKLRDALDTLNRQMGDSPQLAVQALDSVGALAKVINDRRGEVDTLLKSMDVVSQLVADNQNSVLLLLTRGEAIGTAVQKRQDLLRQLLDNVAALSKLLQDMGLENNAQLGPTIQSLNTMSEGLEKNKENLDRLYEIMPVTLRQFDNVLGNGPYGEVYVPWGVFPDNWICFAHVIEGCK